MALTTSNTSNTGNTGNIKKTVIERAYDAFCSATATLQGLAPTWDKVCATVTKAYAREDKRLDANKASLASRDKKAARAAKAKAVAIKKKTVGLRKKVPRHLSTRSWSSRRRRRPSG
eukprot:3466512-Rhodomonas_salina.1